MKDKYDNDINIKEGYYYCIDNNFRFLHEFANNRCYKITINNKFYLKNDTFGSIDVYENGKLIGWFFFKELDFPKHFINSAEWRDKQINSIFEDE